MNERVAALLKAGDDAIAAGRPSDAVAPYRLAAEAAETQLVRSLALHLCGVALWRAARSSESAEVLDRAVELRRAHSAPPLDLAASLNALGSVLVDLEQPEGTAYLEEALELRVAHLGERAPETLATMNNLAVVLDRAGNTEAAYETVARLIPLLIEAGGPGDASVGRALNNLGGLAERLGKLEEAERSFAEAARILRESLGDNSRDVSLARGNLARVRSRRATSN